MTFVPWHNILYQQFTPGKLALSKVLFIVVPLLSNKSSIQEIILVFKLALIFFDYLDVGVVVF
jgi:hypothetical protein